TTCGHSLPRANPSRGGDAKQEVSHEARRLGRQHDPSVGTTGRTTCEGRPTLVIFKLSPRMGAHRLAAAGSLAILALGAAAGSAGAKQPGKDGAFCEGAVSPAFAAFGDRNLYALAPEGDMETALVGWQLADARVVDESEPY